MTIKELLECAIAGAKTNQQKAELVRFKDQAKRHALNIISVTGNDLGAFGDTDILIDK